jgi:NUMOD3 motif
MHCASPLPELLFSSTMATCNCAVTIFFCYISIPNSTYNLSICFHYPFNAVSNAKSFSHAELKLSLPSRQRVVAGRRFYLQPHTRFKLEHATCALSTVESEMLTPISSSELQIGADFKFGAPQDASQEDVNEREKLRRSRISRANKGNIPWNKGKKHSPGWFTPISYIYS